VIRRDTAGARPGLTLIEVLVALAIFLLSLTAISRLVTFAGQRALDARRTEEAARLARSKFSEVFAGVVPLQSSDDTPFDEDPDYSWSLTADSASLSDLWVVSVTVKRKGDQGPGFTLREFMLDPTVRGSTQDTIIMAGSSSSPTGSGSSGGSSGSGNSSMPAVGGGAMSTAGKSSKSAQTSGSGKSAAPSQPSSPGKSGAGSSGGK
jgi:general secretion pathway protein I